MRDVDGYFRAPNQGVTGERARAVHCRWLMLLRTLAASALIASSVSSAAPEDSVDLAGIMRLTVDGWTRSQVDGLFPYGFDFLADSALEPHRMSAPNLARQAFTAFTLARYYEHTRDPRLRQPIAQALAAFRARSLPIGKSAAQRILEAARVLSFPVARWRLQTALERSGFLYQRAGEGRVVSPDEKYSNALAGTVALALLTELVYSRASGDESFAEQRKAWLEGLLALRIPGGGFRQDPTLIDDSDYDNGEGWLALAVYSDAHPDDARTAAVLADLDDILPRRYTETPSQHFFQWGAMAAAQRYRTTHDARFLTYLRRQGSDFIELSRRRLRPSDNNCAAMEGFAAILATLRAAGEDESAGARAIGEWLSREVAKLPRLQIQQGQQSLALGGEAYLRAPRMADYAGGFLSGLYIPVTRVDVAGHCLSAMLTLERHGAH